MTQIRVFFISIVLLFVFKLHAADVIMVVGLFKDKAVVVINGRQHLLSRLGPAVNGVKLIRSNSSEAILEVNGHQQSYRADGVVGSTEGGGSAVEVRLYPDSRGMYKVEGQINYKTISFLVDTGATLIAMSSVHADQLGIQYRLDGKESMAATASGNVKTYIVNLKRVTVGGITVHNIKAAVIQGKHPYTVLLGMSFLSQIKFVSKGRSLILVQE